MKTKLLGIRFLIISLDVSFLRSIKIQLQDRGAEVFLSKNFLTAQSLLEEKNPQIAICYFTNKEEAVEFITIFQKLIPTGLLYFFGKDFIGEKLISKKDLNLFQEQVRFLLPPINWQKIFEQIQNELASRSTDLANLSPEIGKLQYYLLFRSKKMQQGLEFLPKMADTNYSVLITGESGTGKEMVARAIHSLSKRKNKPFIAINCGAIPENLVESELFGYEKGSFTGATATKKGKFELANHGTLLLDEIGDMPLHLQTKLLRILEDGQVFRVGSEKGFSVNIRVLAATNVQLHKKIKEKLFREDLFYRLNILRIQIPPLRERKEDISLLAWHFLQRVLSEINFPAPYPYLTDEAVIELQKYSWYGNVRELKNFMTQLAILLPQKTRKIDKQYIKNVLQNFSIDYSINKKNLSLEKEQDIFQISLDKTLNEAKNLYIEKVLQICNNNKTKASKSLGISLRSLRQKKNSK